MLRYFIKERSFYVESDVISASEKVLSGYVVLFLLAQKSKFWYIRDVIRYYYSDQFKTDGEVLGPVTIEVRVTLYSYLIH